MQYFRPVPQEMKVWGAVSASANLGWTYHRAYGTHELGVGTDSTDGKQDVTSVLHETTFSLDLSKQENRRIVMALVLNFFNSWPYDDIRNGTPVKSRSMNIHGAMACFPGGGEVSVTESRFGYQGWTLYIEYISQSTGESMSLKHKIRIGINAACVIPRLANNVRWACRSQAYVAPVAVQATRLKNGSFSSMLPEDWRKWNIIGATAQTLRDGEKFLRYAASKLTGLVTTKEKLMLAIKQLQRPCDTDQLPRPTPGHGFLDVQTEHVGKSIKLTFSKEVCRISNLRESPGLHDLLSHDSRWLIMVLENVSCSFQETVSLHIALFAFGSFIRAVNQHMLAGAPAPLDCYCEDDSRSDVAHTCHIYNCDGCDG